MSFTPEFSINALIILTRKLTELVTEEASLLKQMKVSEIAAIQQEKNEVASALEKHQNQLRDNPRIRETLTEADKNLLRTVAQEFDMAINIYQVELFKARKVNELVIGKIVDVMQEYLSKNRAYNKRGSQALAGTELANTTPAIKYNTQV